MTTVAPTTSLARQAQTVDRAIVDAEAVKLRTRYYQAQRWWSVTYFGTALASILANTTIPILLNIKSMPALVPAIVSAAAAVLTAFAALAGFQQKWQAARDSRSRVDEVLLELKKSDPDLDALIDELKTIVRQQDRNVISAGKELPPGDPTEKAA